MKIYIIVFFLFILNIAHSQNELHLRFGDSEISIENLLQKYIQIPSISGNEKYAGEFIKKTCKENGLIISDFGSENGSYNFAASIYPLSKNKPNIIFLNHIDVIPENNESENGAYSGKIIADKIFGRGAIDNKGAALMQLYGIIQFINNENIESSKYNVTFLSVSCEETQCSGGVAYVIHNYLDQLNPVVVIGEGPSELTTLLRGDNKYPLFGISIAHKRAFWLDLKLDLKTSAHGSITPLQYANKEMVASLYKLTKKKNKAIFNELNTNFLKALAEQKNGLTKLMLKHPRFFKMFLVPRIRKQPELFAIFSNTITLTNIHTNNISYNKVPSSIRAYLDCRLLPNTNEIDFLKDIKKRLKNDSIKIRITENMPQSEPSSINNLFYINLDKSIRTKYPGSKTLPVLMPNINDLGAFRVKNIPAYATIPVYFTKEQVESIHGINENISIQSLYDGADVYYNFLINMNAEEELYSK